VMCQVRLTISCQVMLDTDLGNCGTVHGRSALMLRTGVVVVRRTTRGSGHALVKSAIASVARGRFAPMRSAPVRSARVRSASLRSAPLRSAPMRRARARFAPLRCPLARIAPVRFAPESFASVRFAPERSAPERSMEPMSSSGARRPITVTAA
jgi:hypothetical protein